VRLCVSRHMRRKTCFLSVMTPSRTKPLASKEHTKVSEEWAPASESNRNLLLKSTVSTLSATCE
jgi:hypothetical protein